MNKENWTITQGNNITWFDRCNLTNSQLEKTINNPSFINNLEEELKGLEISCNGQFYADGDRMFSITVFDDVININATMIMRTFDKLLIQVMKNKLQDNKCKSLNNNYDKATLDFINLKIKDFDDKNKITEIVKLNFKTLNVQEVEDFSYIIQSKLLNMRVSEIIDVTKTKAIIKKAIKQEKELE